MSGGGTTPKRVAKGLDQRWVATVTPYMGSAQRQRLRHLIELFSRRARSPPQKPIVGGSRACASSANGLSELRCWPESGLLEPPMASFTQIKARKVQDPLVRAGAWA